MCWSSAVAGVEYHPLTFITPLTQLIYLICEHVRLFHFNCIELNVHATTIHFNCNFTNNEYGNIILYICCLYQFKISHLVSSRLGKKNTKNISLTIPEQSF